MKSKDTKEVTDAYKALFAQMQADGVEAPMELNTDLESAFKSPEFQALLKAQGTTYRPKTGTKR